MTLQHTQSQNTHTQFDHFRLRAHENPTCTGDILEFIPQLQIWAISSVCNALKFTVRHWMSLRSTRIGTCLMTYVTARMSAFACQAQKGPTAMHFEFGKDRQPFHSRGRRRQEMRQQEKVVQDAWQSKDWMKLIWTGLGQNSRLATHSMFLYPSFVWVVIHMLHFMTPSSFTHFTTLAVLLPVALFLKLVPHIMTWSGRQHFSASINPHAGFSWLVVCFLPVLTRGASPSPHLPATLILSSRER